jgi:membrane protease YdiL (CAAX protease family)
MLKALTAYIRREPWTFAMAACLTIVMAASWFAPRAPRSADTLSESGRLQTTQKIEALGKRLAEDDSARPAMVMVSLILTGLILIGSIWGTVWMGSIRRGERWMDRFGDPRLLWGAGEIFKALVLLFFLDLVLSTTLGYALGFLGNGSMNIALMTGSLLRSVLILMFLYRIAKRGGGGWTDLGWCLNRFWTQTRWGLAGYLAMIPVYMFILGVLMLVLSLLKMESPVQAPVQILYTESNTAALWAFALFMGVLGPWFEEILFRGFLYPVLRARAGVWTGVLATSILFAALHGHGIAFAPILVLGLALNLLYERSGSVIPGAVLHMTHNCAMLAVTFWIKGMSV